MDNGDVKYIFFFQAEDGIPDRNVTGVQTCALPISCGLRLTACAYLGPSLQPLEQPAQPGRHLYAENVPGRGRDHDGARPGRSLTAGRPRAAGPSLRPVGRIRTAAIALVGLPLAALAGSTAGPACPTRSARSARAASLHQPGEEWLVHRYHDADAAAPAPGRARSTGAAVAPRGARLRGASRRARRAVGPVAPCLARAARLA